MPALDPAMIPGPLLAYVEDVAERLNVPLEFVAIGMIVALGSLVGRRLAIRPKQFDDWYEVMNFWGAIIGRPSLKKSPALSEALKFLERMIQEAKKEYMDRVAEHEVDAIIAKARRESWEKAIKETARIKDPAEREKKLSELKAEAAETSEPPAPTERRYKTSDTTVEKLVELLGANPTMLIFRDELVAWVRNLEKQGREADRAFMLEAWNGKVSHECDRIGRGSKYVPALCISVLGGIQPGPLGTYLRAANRGGAGADGLVQRFQLLVWPDEEPYRRVDRWPDKAAKDSAHQIFRALADFDPAEVGAQTDPLDPDAVPWLRFTSEGQEVFDNWLDLLETTKLRNHDDGEALESHLAKYRGLMPKLAALFHLIAVVGGEPAGGVSQRTALMAAAWCEFLEAHARRIYGATLDNPNVAARALATRITSGTLVAPFTIREVWKHHWSELDTAADAERAAETLVDLDWLRSEELETGGRPSTIYHLNPRVKVTEKPGVSP